MRRATRSKSNVDAIGSRSASLRRSLRSTNIEEFYEIPTSFRMRSPRPSAPPEKTIEKSPPTRRSLRLNTGSDFDEGENKLDAEDSGSCRTRKRRFTSCPNEMSPTSAARKGRDSPVKAAHRLEIGPKPSKLMHIDETSKHSSDDGSSSINFSNGICSRTRLKREYLKENGICDLSDDDHSSAGSTKAVKDSKSDLENSVHSSNENGFKDNADHRLTPKQSRMTRARNTSKISSSQGCEDCGVDAASDRSSSVNETENGGLTSAVNDADGKTPDVQGAKCVCEPAQKNSGEIVCDYCGKPCSPQRKNGSIRVCQSDIPPDTDEGGAVAHSLRSNSRTSMSPFSPECAGSPLAAEEAGVKSGTKVNGDELCLHHRRRRSRRLSEKGEPFPTWSSDPEGATSDTKEKKPSSPQISDHLPASDSENKDCTTDKRPDNDEHPSPSSKVDEKHDVLQKNGTEDLDVKEKTLEEDDANTKAAGEQPNERLCQSVFEEFACDDLDLSAFSDGESDSTVMKKRRRMNLRSSGVRCDPDFYTLSLDLMIKRPALRKHLHCDMESSRPVPEPQTTAQTDSSETKLEKGHTPLLPVDTADENDIKSLFTNISATPNSVPADVTSTNYPEVCDAAVMAPLPQLSSTPSRPNGSTLRKIPPRGKGRGPKGLASARLDKPSAVRMVLPNPSEPPPLFTEEPPSGPDVYFFESDHVALKHNKDYHDLLHIVSMLESQRHQCLRDVESLEKEKDMAMDEPIAFVEKLQTQVKLDLPVQQKVPPLPEVDWSRYSSVYGTFGHVFSRDFSVSPKKPVTRKVKINFETGVPLQPTKCSSEKLQGKIKGDSSQGESSRSQTFNVPWNVEEQRKLEELLQKFPSEDIEFNRYRKIADAIGNRTALQVQSRVQKYFLKLAKAGLPIPGHMPRVERYLGGSGRNRKARPHPHTHLTKMSTFFPKFHIPVRMQDDDQEHGSYGNDDDDGGGWTIDQDQVSDEEDVLPEMRYSDEYLEILRLKRMRRERLRVVDQHGRQALAQHTGYECDMCNCDPIQGVRYHCIDCPTEDGVDLCQSCIRLQGQFETESHKTSHRMEPVYKADNFMDDDYIKFMSRSGEYNYLDPNFFPPHT